MALDLARVDPNGSGSSGLLTRGVYSRPSETIAEITAPGYFNSAFDVMRRVGVLRVYASDGEMDFRLSSDSVDRVITLRPDIRLQRGQFEYITPYDKGAVLNGTTDDFQAAQEAVEEAISTGKTFAFNGAPMYLSEPLRFGRQLYDAYEFIIDRTVADTDAGQDANFNAPNNTYNGLHYVPCNIVCETGAIVVAGFTPSVYKAVIEHNLSSLDNLATFQGPLHIAIPGAMNVAGKLKPYQLYPASAGGADNKLIGFAMMNRGLKRVSGVAGYGMGGSCLVMNRPYWNSAQDIKAMFCGDAAHYPGSNAMEIGNVELWLGARGVVYDGGVGIINSVHSEHIAGATLKVFQAGSITVNSMYLEDTLTDDGTGLYAIELGEGSGEASKILFSRFTALRRGAERPNKKFMRMWGTAQCVVEASSLQSAEIDQDSVSNCIWIASGARPAGLDTIRNPVWSTTLDARQKTGVKTLMYDDLIDLGAFDFGTINNATPGGHTFTIAALPSGFSYYEVVHVTHNGSPKMLLQGKISSTTALRIDATTASPTDILGSDPTSTSSHPTYLVAVVRGYNT